MSDKHECIDKHERILTLEEIVFGNPKTGEKGMKQKVDEMHTILTQAKGMPWILGFVVLLGSALTVIKVWLSR